MSLGGVSENDRECWWTARMHFVYVCVFWISMLCAFACTTHVHVHLYMYHPCVSSMLGWFAFVNLCVHACMYAYVSVCVRVADYWAGMPCGFMLFHTKQWNRYLFVTDKTGWPEIGMHIITRAHTLGSVGAALCAYARTALTGVCFVHAICACAWAVHSFKDTMHSPSYSFHFPRDKVPISPLPAVRERKMGGVEWAGGKERDSSEKKTQMLSAHRESPGSLSCVSQCNTTLPDKPVRLLWFCRDGLQCDTVLCRHFWRDTKLTPSAFPINI